MVLAPTLSSPFVAGGTATALDVPELLPVAIEGHPYQIRVKDYRRQTVPATRQPIDQGVEAGEQSLNPVGLWRRSQSDWSLGGGQEFLDRSRSTRDRFWSSKGLDPWTQHKLSMLPDTASRLSSSATNLQLLAVPGYLYAVDGSAVKFTADPAVVSPTWSSIAAGGTVNMIATDGTNIYIARSGAAIQKATIGSTSAAAFGAETPTMVGFANGRLLAGVANVLKELSNVGAATTVMTHFNTAFVWVAAIGAPGAILAAGNAGDRAQVYSVPVDPSSGALAEPVPACSLPPGETIYGLAADPGTDNAVLLATSAGLRLALINADATLNLQPPIDTYGPVRCLDPQGRFVWFGITNYDTTSTGLGRADLSVTPTSGIPAYATDLMASVQGTVLSTATFAAKHYLAVSGQGVYGETTTKVASADILSGWLDYGTLDRKVTSSFDLRHDALDGRITVSLHIEADDPAAGGTHVEVGTASVQGSLGPGDPFAAGQNATERVQVHLEFFRSATDSTLGPVLRRWVLRALPAPTRTDEIIVPIVMHSAVTANNETAEPFEPLTEFLFLKGLEESGRAVRYQEGAAAYDVTITQVEVVPDKWMDDFSFFEATVVVHLLTVNATA